jgi:hypothetical protein
MSAFLPKLSGDSKASSLLPNHERIIEQQGHACNDGNVSNVKDVPTPVRPEQMHKIRNRAVQNPVERVAQSSANDETEAAAFSGVFAFASQTTSKTVIARLSATKTFCICVVSKPYETPLFHAMLRSTKGNNGMFPTTSRLMMLSTQYLLS